MKILRFVSVGIPVAVCSQYLSTNTDKSSSNFPSLISIHASQRRLHLEQVQVLFRHGARTPIKSEEVYENFSNLDAVVWDKERFAKVLPHVDIDYTLKSFNGKVLTPRSHRPNLLLPGGCLGGDLTTVGQQEAFEFGSWLASEYIVKHALISPTYKNDAVYVRSTNTQRTVFTALGVMAGLYGKENLSEPVLIHSKVKNEDSSPNWGECSNIKKLFQYHWMTAIMDGQKELNKEMGLKDGAKMLNYVEIHDIVAQRGHHGLFVPKYLVDKEKEISELAMTCILGILGDGDVSQLKNSVGSLVETICCNIDQAIAGTSQRNVLFYATHDTTIICLLQVLGIFDYSWPPFLANIIVELYKSDSGERFIRVLHNREVVILDKESGEEYLPVEKFMKLVEKYRVIDWAEDCGNDH